VADFVHVDAARNIIFDARTKGPARADRRGWLARLNPGQTDDATLLAHKSQAQKVKELVKRLASDPKLKRLVDPPYRNAGNAEMR